MNVNELSELTDKEKLIIFNITLEQAKESGLSFESQIGAVLNAFHISKKEPEISMEPSPEYTQEKFEFDMTPSPEYTQEKFEFDMTPSPEYVPEKIEFDMTPNPEYIPEYLQEKFEFDMTPSPEYMQEKFEMNMDPGKKDSDTNYDGPVMEPIDTQKVDNDYTISM